MHEASKFFVGGIPCLTGSLTALGNAATMALANPNGGSLVSINNASFGYLTEAGINQRYCGLSDELVDRCLDAYVGGATAGYAWKTAIARFADTMFSEDGLKGEEAAQRGYDDSENIPYIYAALVQQNLFGDPLVKIQTESKTTIAATVNRTARDHGFAADEFANALTELAKGDALTMTVSNTCGSDATAITVPAGKTLTVNLNTTLTAENVTVAGTLAGAGSINGNLAFAENATLDASKPNKIRVAAGKTIATTGTGLNILLAEGTPVPAVKTLPVLEQSGCSVTGLAVKSVTSGGKTLTGPFELVGERDKLFLTHDAVVALYSEKNTSDKGAVVLSVYVTSETGVETLLAKSGSGEQYWQIPTGSKVKVTYGPDASHSGDTNTIVLNAVYEVYSFLFHYAVLLFCHSTAHKVASAVRISRNIAHYLHYLLLVYHTAVRYIENRFKAFIRIFYVIRIAPVFKIPRYLIHRTRTVKRNSGNYIFYIYRLQFLEE